MGIKSLIKSTKKLMVIQDEFIAVIFSLSDCHIYLRPIILWIDYCRTL
jgi:hypothetical protein